MIQGGGITIIKMDIEGFELPTLQGGENTLIKNRPILTISAYHKRDDVFKIYQYLSGILKNYKFYFRCHKYMACDAVLYAIPEERSI